MYETSDIRKGLKVKINGDPWTVVSFQFVKPGKGNAFTRTRLKNLKTGQVVEKTYKTGEKLEEANFEEKYTTFLYSDGENFCFMDKNNYEQMMVPNEIVGDNAKYLMDNMEVTVLFYEGAPMSLELPTFIEAEIIHSEPGIKGDTATGVTKPATLSTGAEVSVPLFINQGDWIKVDTRDGSYVERVRK
ncbi:MAG: elongation factor P [Deltaproteobacteria bacterium]|nr:elongation factor P [Deltaproteobacteria bacterium]